MTSKRLMGTLAVMLLTATAIAQTANTYYSQQCDAYNNTSAVNGGFDLSNGNAATWNISKVPVRKLLYPNATTRVYAHFLPWSCMPGGVESHGVTRCNGHVVTGYHSNDVYTVGNQVNDMISRGADGVIVDYYRTTLED